MATNFNLKKCKNECTSCIKKYAQKHLLKKGDEFKIPCSGIPEEYIPANVINSLDEDADIELILAMYDPIVWARRFLNWYCLDEDGQIWKEKTISGTLPANASPYDKNRALLGKSPFNRKYQYDILSCSSRYKVLRLGRQCGKTEVICIYALFYMFTREKFKVVIIVPYETQALLIHTRLNELINSSSSLSTSISSSTKSSPPTVELNNGSSVMLFTAGSKTGGEAGSARGQTPSLLMFDEADFLRDADIDASVASGANNPNILILMSSTPKRIEGKFHKTCKSINYKEFHCPSTLNPNYTEELDAYFKHELTEMGYQREILALFGNQEEGVYQQKYILAAQSNKYEYGQLNYNKDFKYSIGVDWNKAKHGTNIAVVCFNSKEGRFYVVDKAVITSTEFTQLSACKRIAELNGQWNCSYIYCDAGYGTIIEVLHDYGLRSLRDNGPNHQDSKLRFAKSFDFGSNLEVRDPFTKEMVKKPAKPFLVENSVRRFENGQIKYPESDVQYSAQLSNYIIDRVTTSGRPVYKTQNENIGDHFLDAVNLALISFTLEDGLFGKVIYNPEVRLTGNFGDGLLELKNIPIDNSVYIKGNSDISNKASRTKNISANIEAPKVYDWPGFLRDQPRPVTAYNRLRNRRRTNV